MNSAPTLGLPIVYLVDDEEVVRDALGWLLRYDATPGVPNLDQQWRPGRLALAVDSVV